MGRKNHGGRRPNGLRRFIQPIKLKRTFRECRSGKHRFDTESRALLAAIKYEGEYGQKQRTYQCPDCHGWHLSTKYL